MTDNFSSAILGALEQKDKAAQTSPIEKSRTVAYADQLGRQGLAAAEAEALNEVLMKLIRLCYQTERGRFINIDPHIGRLVKELPVPWSSKNFKRYGLMRREQADVLRWVMNYYDRNQEQEALFRYSQSSRRWHVNLAHYPTQEDALQWMKANEMNAGRWLSALEKQSATSRTPTKIHRRNRKK